MLSDLRLVMTEDRLGRLWIGSDEGINVFDGYQLSGYSVPGNSGLLNNNVQRIYCDKQGTIWIYTPSGIQYKKENTSRFIPLVSGGDTMKGAPFFSSGAPFFGETTGGDLIIINQNNCYRVNQQLQVTKRPGLAHLFEKYKGPLCLEKFKGDQWFIGFGRKLVLVDIEQGHVINELPFMNTWCVSYVSDSTAMAGSFVKDSLVIINTRNGQMESINDWPTSDGERVAGFAASIYPIGNNKYAIGCRLYGVYIADLTTRKMLHLTHDPADPSTIKTNYVRRLFITRNGTMFVHARAISYTPLQAPQFHTVKSLINNKGEKFDEGFTSFRQDQKNNFWISTNGNLSLWNRLTGISNFYPFYDLQSGPQKIKTVRAVVIDSLDRPWVGTFGGGLGMLKPDGQYEQHKRRPDDPEHTLPSNDIHFIATDPQQNFIICSNYGFAFFKPVSKTMQTYYNHPVLKSIARKHTFSAMADKDNNWWLGQEDGIYFYDRKNERLHKIEQPNDIIDKQVQSFATDSMGNVYAGGNSGLYIISRNKLTVQKWLNKKDGLTSNTVNSLVCDKTGLIWIIGNIGTASYNPTTGQLRVFDANHGLEQTNHPFGSGYLAPDGEIFIASSEGFNHFYPEKIEYRETPISVFITSLELKDTILSSPILTKASFSHRQNNFSFTYLVVDFKIAPAIQYRYKLSGFDTAYVYAGKQRTARYTNLPAGTYSFMVEASSNGKEWFGSRQSLSFMIKKAWWTQWWIRLLLLSVVVAGVYYYYRNRINQINKQARVRSDYEIKLNELENSALRTQMNPHFIFNSLNTINSFINSNERTQANQYIGKFSRLVRLILDHSRQKKIPLKDELEVAELYMQLEQIRFQNRFVFKITINDIDPQITEVPPLIIQPFIENAILHGLLPSEKEGLLKLSIQKTGDMLHCEIEDNGIGRLAARKIKEKSGYHRQSHGMEITMKRIELFNKENGVLNEVQITDLQDSTGEVTGTRVEIRLAFVETF